MCRCGGTNFIVRVSRVQHYVQHYGKFSDVITDHLTLENFGMPLLHNFSKIAMWKRTYTRGNFVIDVFIFFQYNRLQDTNGSLWNKPAVKHLNLSKQKWYQFLSNAETTTHQRWDETKVAVSIRSGTQQNFQTTLKSSRGPGTHSICVSPSI